MFKRFKLQGNRCFMRTEEELLTVDKKAADLAFEKYRKEILGQYLIQQGFLKWKACAYVRLNQIGLLEYIDLQKEGHGSRTFTVNCAVMPLYVPMDCIMTGLGDRLGSYITGKDIWWDYADDEIAKRSFHNVLQAVEQFVMPWFQKFHDETYYKKRLKRDSGKPFCGYDAKLWLEYAERNEETVVLENIKRLKLPGKLFGSGTDEEAFPVQTKANALQKHNNQLR